MPNVRPLRPTGQLPTWLALLVIAVPTFIIWHGALYAGFTVDDYMIIDTQSPIASLTDVLSMFWRSDPNPEYWRPLANASVSMDFLLWGWHGGLFHLTNLVLHLVATTLVYLFAFRVLRLAHYVSIGVALFFGVAACHDANILWIAARADILATICILATLVTADAAYRAPEQKRWQYLSMLFFVLGLCAKEIGAVSLVLLPMLIWSETPRELLRNWKRVTKQLAPYFFLAVIFLFIRLQFTSIVEVQPLASDGSSSVFAFFKNTLYSIGYVVLPLDFQTASKIIDEYIRPGAALAFVLVIVALVAMWETGGSKGLLRLYKPLVFIICTGIISFQAFERWRVYAPSVGIFITLALIISVLWDANRLRPILRTLAMLLLLGMAVYNIRQASTKQVVWEQATQLVERYKNDLKEILRANPERPLRLNVLTSPAKFGEAPLIQLMRAYLAIAAEAELRQDPLLEVGSLGSAKEEISELTNLDIVALDPEQGFDGFYSEQDYFWSLHASAMRDDPIGFTPTALRSSTPLRDRRYKEDSTYTMEGAKITVRKAYGAFIKSVQINVTDTLAVPVYFDGAGFTQLIKETH